MASILSTTPYVFNLIENNLPTSSGFDGIRPSSSLCLVCQLQLIKEKMFPNMRIFVQIRGYSGMVLLSFSTLSPSNNKMEPQQSLSSLGLCCAGQSGSSTCRRVTNRSEEHACCHPSCVTERYTCLWGIFGFFPSCCNNNSKAYKK